MALLKKSKNVLDANFIEGMACLGGCIGGAGCLTHGEKNKAEVDKYGMEAYEKTISEAVSVLMPDEAVHAAFLTGEGRLVTVGDAPNVAGGSVATPSAVGHTSAPAAPVTPVEPARVRTARGPEDSPQGSLF